ncbi:tyrosine-protein phosphatase [Micrococcoides hystricis]|uniref:Tyrosine-protein phosphatase n=1 Tax=Micrococcoides hystricis TaxID=1572761 RepID=A0ABV6P7Z6_9MICC
MRKVLRPKLEQDTIGLDNFRSPLPHFFRSASWTHRLSEPVAVQLRQKISLIVDLREPGETESDFFIGQRDWDPSTGIERIHLPLYRRTFGDSPVPVLSDINSVYFDLLTESGPAFAQIISTISQHFQRHSGGVLIHCGAGKDRTGLVTAMLMQLADRPTGRILADYTRTETDTSPAWKAQTLSRLHALGLHNHPRWNEIQTLHLEAPAAVLMNALQVLSNLGGTAYYLRENGCRTRDLVYLNHIWTFQEALA